jgi:hypothetical protein
MRDAAVAARLDFLYAKLFLFVGSAFPHSQRNYRL